MSLKRKPIIVFSAACIVLAGSYLPSVYGQTNATNILQNYRASKSQSKITTSDQFKTVVSRAYLNLQPTLSVTMSASVFKQSESIIQSFYGLNSAKYSYSNLGNTYKITFNFDYKQVHKLVRAIKNPSLSSKLNASDQKLLKTATSLQKKITAHASNDFEKELAIHDYIVNNTSYCSNPNSSSDNIYTAAGVFYDHVAVCQGYSEAMHLLLTLSDIDNTIVTGTARSGAHAWNEVKLDNEWYMVDVTFDDPITTDMHPVLQYDYFNLTSEQLKKDHYWNVSNYPVARGTKFNYFNYKHLVANNYDEFKSIMLKQLNEGKTTLICYVKNYSPQKYSDFTFVYKYCNQLSYSVPASTEGVFTIQIKDR